MSAVETRSASSSQDYFGSDDDEFLAALQTTVLNTRELKRQHSEVDEATVEADDTYNAVEFGGIGQFKRIKLAKLQIQNGQLAEESSKLFEGLAIFITGYTVPSLQDLRQLLVQHGGVFHAYLNKKSVITHIVTLSLPPAKALEYKAMKIVKPAWLVDSVECGTLLPWRDYIYQESNRLHDDADGAKSAQTSLTSFITQTIPSTQDDLDDKAKKAIQIQQEDADIYGPSRFGHGGQYLARKRAKMQIQNMSMHAIDDSGSGIFKGLAIYINGYTDPSVQDLRALIVKHGGIYHPYLDSKLTITHVVTQTLTPAKIRDFKHLKIATPAWLVDSVEAGVLLPWSDYIWRESSRLDKGEKQAAQASLFKFASSTPRVATQSAEVDLTLADTDRNIEDESLTVDSSYLNPPPPAQPPRARILSPQPSAHTMMPPPHIPSYASGTSNPHAERAMAKPGWRQAHTSAAPDFIEGYYKNSRLHYLSTWKAELKVLVAEAASKAEAKSEQMHFPKKDVKGKGKARAEGQEERVIMHCDFDCFFVAAGLIGHPALRGKPVVVCHSQGQQGGGGSTSEVACASYEARAFGVKNGMSLQQARALCPTIMTLPYEFERYKRYSLMFYTVLMSHADDLQAVSVDEALIDATQAVVRFRSQSEETHPDPTKAFADMIRAQVKAATMCEISIGISHNILLARLATRHAKPAGSFHLTGDVSEFIAPLDITDLPGFGRAAKQKALEKLGSATLGDLTNKSKSVLCDVLGNSNGETLYKAIRGIDERKLESDKPRKSVSCEINYGIRFEDNSQAKVFVHDVGKEVAKRLDEAGFKGRSLTLKIMKRQAEAPIEAPKFLGHGICDTFNKNIPISGPNGHATSDPEIIGQHAWRLLESWKFDPQDLRGIGIHIAKLDPNSGESTTEPGQRKLLFATTAAETVSIKSSVARPPSKLYAHDLPTFSQIDMDVFRALPEEMQREVEQECKSRSASPFPAEQQSIQKRQDRHALPTFSQIDLDVLNALPQDLRQEVERESRSRSASPFLFAGPSNPTKSKKITIKGSTLKGIAKSIGLRGKSSVSPTMIKRKALFEKRAPLGLRISDEALRELDIDPEVFRMLPEMDQREQLSLARVARTVPQKGIVPVIIPEKRKTLKPFTRKAKRHRRITIRARYLPAPVLKQYSEVKGEKLVFRETDEVQDVIAGWVNQYKEECPDEKDIAYFSKFLVKSVDGVASGDDAMEKAVAVLKWWLILVRRNWGCWENVLEAGETLTQEEITGRAWWKAFRQVKEAMNDVARKRFGGCLSLK